MGTEKSFQSRSHYEFKKYLGQGSSAEVFLYLRKTPGLPHQEVVLKILKQKDPQFLKELLNEGELLSTLRHPNIVATYGYEQTDREEMALILEYVPGTNLRHIMETYAKENLAERKRLARYVGRILLQALSAAHSQGVIHGDLSPQNILVSQSGELKLSDFGLSRLVGKKKEFRDRGSIDYLAPERWDGESITASSDIFAVAMILFEIIQGRNPVRSANLKVSKIKQQGFLAKKPWRHFGKWTVFFDRVLHLDPKNRASIKDLLAFLAGTGDLDDVEVQSHLKQKLTSSFPQCHQRTQTLFIPQRVLPKMNWFASVILAFSMGTAASIGTDHTGHPRLRPCILTVTSSPWGEIFIDGKSQGYTPILNLPLKAGYHQFLWRDLYGHSIRRSIMAYDNGFAAYQLQELRGGSVTVRPIQGRKSFLQGL